MPLSIAISSKKSRARALIGGVAASYTNTSINLALNLIMTPFILTMLGSSRFGTWNIILQIQGYLGLLDFGFSTGSVRTIAFYGETTRKTQAAVINTLFRIYLKIGFLVFIMGIIISCVIWVKYTPVYTKSYEVALSFGIMSFGSALLMPLSISIDYLQAKQKLSLVYNLYLVRSIIEALTILALLLFGYGLVGMAIAQVVAAFIFYSTATYYLLKDYGPKELIRERCEHKVRREAISITKYTFLQKLSNLGLRGTDGILIGFVLGPQAVTIYVITQKIILTAISLLGRAIPLLLPGLTELWFGGLISNLATIYKRAGRILMLSFLGAGVFSAIINSSFVNLWIGFGRVGSSALICLITVSTIMLTLSILPQVLLTAANQLKIFSFASLLEAAIKIGFALLFLKHFGLIGLPIASIVAWLVTFAFFYLYEVSKALSVPKRILLWETVIGPALTFILLSLPIIVVGGHLRASSWPSLVYKASLLFAGLITCTAIQLILWGDWHYLRSLLVIKKKA